MGKPMKSSSVNEKIAKKWKAALIVIGVVIGTVLLLLAVWKVPELLVRGYHGKLDSSAISKLTPQELIQLQKDLITAENNARMTFAQIIGGIALLFGLTLTYRNIKVTEEGKLTERFSKAVELLGNKENLEIRLGGIYALERIARDSKKDHWTVMEVLTAFVREQSGNEYEETTDADGNITLVVVEHKPSITVDIQAALTVIGRREWAKQEQQEINLMGSFLQGTVLFDANLKGANFCNTILTQSLLIRTDLRNATLINTTLIEADLNHAKLKDAHLFGAKLIGADLRTSIGLTWEQISEAIIDETTKLSPELERRRKAEQAKKAAAPNQ
jgi:hypothetical protein